MKTVSIKNVRYVAETGHIVAVAKDGQDWLLVQNINLRYLL
jgi:hypothetical protein